MGCAKRNRKYPDIKVGDDVRVIIKKIIKQKAIFQSGQLINTL